jgi:CubicO group peptidase (beta-lactamase class C family)
MPTLYDPSPAGFRSSANQDSQFLSSTYFSGAAGLASSTEDYRRFAQMLCNGGELNGKRLLSPRTVALMSSNHVGDMFNHQLGSTGFYGRGMGFGYLVRIMEDATAAGWRVTNGSYGWYGALGTQVWIDPKEQMVTLLMVQSLRLDLQRDFENAVMQAVID